MGTEIRRKPQAGDKATRELRLTARPVIDQDARTVELAFASEAPVERWYGMEVLRCKPEAVRMDRLTGGAALLLNHDADRQIGVVERASVDPDGLCRARVRFSRSDAASEIFQDVVDGIRSLVSVGYMIHKYEEGTDRNQPVFTATDWEPFEISIVSVPADTTVGVGRSAPVDPTDIISPAPTLEVKSMTDITAAETAEKSAPAAAGLEQRHIDAGKAERDRIMAISSMCEQWNIDHRSRQAWIEGGADVPTVQAKIMDVIKERQKSEVTSAAHLGLSGKELGRYSVLRAVSAAVNKDWTKAGFELDCHRAIAAKVGGMPKSEFSVYVPADALGAGRRDLDKAGAGASLIQTDLVSFIDLLRNRSVMYSMGATRLSGLQGHVAIPKQTGAATGYWLTNDATPITESQQTFTQVTMSPKNVGAYTEITRQLMMQSSIDAENLVMSDIAKVIALAVDSAALNGDGTGGAPTGVLQTGSIGSVTGTSLAYAQILEFQTDVAASNALTMGCGYLTTPAVAALLKGRVRVSGTDSPLWEGNILDGTVEGFRAMTSLQMPSATMAFGDWSQVVIGEWGVLELDVNPYADFKAGIVGLRAFYSCDVAVRYAGAFSKAATIT